MDSFREAAQYYPLKAQLYGRVADLIAGRLRGDENTADVLVGGAYVASLRLAARGKPAKQTDSSDLIFALSIFSWWPFKPYPAPHVEEQLLSLRAPLFKGLAGGSIFEMEALRTTVPEQTLRMDLLELYDAQRSEIGAFLKTGGQAAGWP